MSIQVIYQALGSGATYSPPAGYLFQGRYIGSSGNQSITVNGVAVGDSNVRTYQPVYLTPSDVATGVNGGGALYGMLIPNTTTLTHTDALGSPYTVPTGKLFIGRPIGGSFGATVTVDGHVVGDANSGLTVPQAIVAAAGSVLASSGGGMGVHGILIPN